MRNPTAKEYRKMLKELIANKDSKTTTSVFITPILTDPDAPPLLKGACHQKLAMSTSEKMVQRRLFHLFSAENCYSEGGDHEAAEYIQRQITSTQNSQPQTHSEANTKIVYTHNPYYPPKKPLPIRFFTQPRLSSGETTPQNPLRTQQTETLRN